MSRVYYTGKKMFDGKKVVENFALLVEDGKILAAGTQSEVACPADACREGGNLFVIRDRRLRRRKSCDGNAER